MKKFYDVLAFKSPAELAIATTEDQTVAYKVIGIVSADFPDGLPHDDTFGRCEAAVSFELYKRGPRASASSWIPIQDELYHASSSYHILPSCAAINDKLRALSNDLISRILARIESDRQAR